MFTQLSSNVLHNVMKRVLKLGRLTAPIFLSSCYRDSCQPSPCSVVIVHGNVFQEQDLSIECCRRVLLGAACLALKDSEKTNNSLIFFPLSLMHDSLAVLSEFTEYPLCRKQAVQTEYMITHCLEGVQGPSCACINSS